MKVPIPTKASQRLNHDEILPTQVLMSLCSRSGDLSEKIDSAGLGVAGSLIKEKSSGLERVLEKETSTVLKNSMTDKLSSPSSSSSHSAHTPRSRGSAREDPSFVILRQPPSFVFPNESFEIEVGLEIPRTASPVIQQARAQIHVSASLCGKTGGPISPSIASLISSPSDAPIICSGNNRIQRTTLHCVIQADRVRRDQITAFTIKVSQRSPVDQVLRDISDARTRSIQLVNYKTSISPAETWEKVWYKDEGGRDKSIQVHVGLYDRNGHLLKGENVPLDASLYYKPVGDGSPIKVSNQDILRTLGHGRLQVDKNSGFGLVKFRVEDVSKNHQGQDFQLRIGADPKSKGFRDVAPTFTDAVSIRSKRNKRTRQLGSSSSSRSGPTTRASPRQRISYDDAGGASQRDLFDENADASRLREAMKGIINWTEEVVNGLYPLQWQLIGYATNPDGSPDYNRPYHNMPNPNACISRILAMYADSIRENLRFLTQAIENSVSGRGDQTFSPRHRDAEGAAYQGAPIRSSSIVASPPAMQTHRSSAFVPGMHSSAFESKSDMMMYPHPGLSQPLPPVLPGNVPMRPLQQPPPAVPGSAGQSAMALPPEGAHQASLPAGGDRFPDGSDDIRESEVEYVLAKQYKAIMTGEPLGFPAYSASKEILGFYCENGSKVGVGHHFVPISQHREEFGPMQMMQATEILEDAMQKKNGAVLALKDFGSIGEMIDHALVFDWSKDIGNDNGTGDGSVSSTG